MTIQFNEESGGRILVVHVSGKLVKEDYAQFVPEFERLLRQHGKLRVLFDMSGLHGWEASVPAAQQALYHGARCNRAARRGEYSAAMESA